MNAQFTADVSGFVDMVNRRAIAFGIGREEAFKLETRLLAEELVERTPPTGGASIIKQLAAQSKKLTAGSSITAGTRAKAIGEAAVKRDMTKLFTKTPKLPPYQENKSRFVFLYQNGDKKYGVPKSFYNPSPTMDWMRGIRGKYMTRNGKIQYNVASEREGKVWINLMKYPVTTKLWNQLYQMLKGHVGAGKSGWAQVVARWGGRVPAWILKHAPKTSRVTAKFYPDDIFISLFNRSDWAKGGDPDRIIPKALAGRAESLKAAIWRQMNDAWKKGGTVPK